MMYNALGGIGSVPGLAAETRSVTFCIKMRPLSCSLGLPRLSTSCLFEYLFLGLDRSMSLQQRRMVSKR